MNSIACDTDARVGPPEFLRQLPNWLCWKFEANPGGGKMRKTPFYATGGRRQGVQGSDVDRAKLVTFDVARAAAARQGMDGVGIALLQGDGLVALDFDHCLNDGVLHPEVHALLGTTYAEVSPSGTGVRAFFAGQVGNDKDSGNPEFGLELFSTKGYCTFTGAVLPIVEMLGNENTVAPVDDAVMALVRKRFGDREAAQDTSAGSERLNLDPELILQCLQVLPLDLEYDQWLEVGLALHHELGPVGFEAWHAWSTGSPKYTSKAYCAERWRSFGKNTSARKVTARSLVHLANQHGARIDLRDIASPDEFVAVDSVAPPPPEVEGLPQFPQPFRGPMRAIVDATLKASPKPQPSLAVLAALVGMAAGCDGCFATPGGMRLNLYALGIADTGAGKDLPRHASIAVARSAGALPIGKPASGQGLEDALRSRKGMLIEVDEIGHMLAAINSKGAASYQIDMAGILLRLYSASSGPYNTRVRATTSSAPSGSRSVENPCVSLIGFTTPQSLGAAVGMANVHDGLLGRMLCAFGDPDVTPRRLNVRFELPDAAVDAALGVDMVAAASPSDLCCIEVSPGANAKLDGLLIEFDTQMKAGNSIAEKALRARSYEKCERIAGVLAVWDNPHRPEVVVEHVEWAAQAVRASDDSMIRFTEMHMHAGEVQRNAALVVDTVGKILRGKLSADRAGEQIHVENGRVPRSLVLRRSKLSADDLDRAVSHAMAAGDLVRESPLPEGAKRAVECYRVAVH